MKHLLHTSFILLKRANLFLAFLLLSNYAFSQSSTQVIKGRIVDEITQIPIPGVTVILLNSNPVVGANTDLDGFYKLNAPIGRQAIQIKYLGYEDKVINDIIVSAGKEVNINVFLTENIKNMKEVEVVYDRSKDGTVTTNDMALISARSFNIDDTKRYAGSLGDPSRMAANFAGVIAGNDSRNDIVVRGNSPIGMLWQLEGLNIPNPNHFGSLFSTGGPVSMLNNNVLAKSDFLSGAFPSMYGNANAAVFDVNLREGNNDKAEFIGQIGFNGFEVGAEGPFKKGSKASYLFNYRYSTLGLLKNVGVDPGTGAATPKYQDLNMKIAIPFDDNSKLTFFGLFGNSMVDLLGEEVDTTKTDFYGEPDENLYPRYNNAMFGSSYERNLSAKTFLKVTAAGNYGNQNYYIDSIAVDEPNKPKYRSAEGDFTTTKFLSRVELSHKLNSKNSLKVGGYADLTNIDYFNKDIFNGTEDRVYVDANETSTLYQAYAQWKHRFNERWTFSGGVHSQYFDLNDQIVVEPRLAIKYVLTPLSSLSLAYGLHHQQQNIYTYYVETPTANGVALTNKELDFTRSNHLVLAYERQLTERVRLKVETYVQYIDKVPVTIFPSSYSELNQGASFAPSDQDSLVNDGIGNNYGLELTLERSFDKGYYFLITGSLFDSKYEGSDGVERNTAFNTHYAYNILGGKEWKVGKKKDNVFSIGLKLTSTGGRYLTPIDLEASEEANVAVEDEANAYSLQQDPYFRADLKFGYRKEYKSSTLEFSVDLQNITNNQNVFDQGYNSQNNTISTEYQQGFFPVPMVRYTF
jgi:hypothetical protein